MAHKNSKSPRYSNPKAPKEGDGTKRPFLVAPHANIFGESIHGKVKKIRGSADNNDDRTIMLTETMATFYANLGYIEVKIDFDSDKDAEIAELRQQKERLEAELASKLSTDTGASGQAQDDDGQTSNEGASDTGGRVSSDGSSSEPDDETAKPTSARRRRTL